MLEACGPAVIFRLFRVFLLLTSPEKLDENNKNVLIEISSNIYVKLIEKTAGQKNSGIVR